MTYLLFDDILAFFSHFILMSLHLSPLKLARLVTTPGVTDKLNQIFCDQPLLS